MDPVALAQAGPVAILLVAIGLLYRAFIRGDVVPGHLYRDEVARADRAETQAERNTAAIEAVAATLKAAGERARRSPRA